jgi:hypothetical protein
MSSPNVKPSKEGSHSARESTSRLARDEEANDEEAGKNRRERNSQDLKKTLSTGSIRSNVEKDASSAKDSKSGGSKQSKSNRDLNKLCQEDKAGLSPNLSLPFPICFNLFPFAYLGGLQSGRRRWARRHQPDPREDAPPRHNRRE